MFIARSFGLGFVAACLAMTAAQALECPLPQAIAKPGVLEEPEAAIDAFASLLSAPDIVQRAPELVARTRLRYPEAGSAEIVNFLLTAYCPIANRQNLSEAEKQALINAFGGAITQLLY